MTPLISIIIPTANRPHYLPRAVDSALTGMNPDDVEVIVVPNGPDESWRESLLPYQNNPSVRVVRIMEANANISRNAGLAEARGEYVRFLDDDDYLIPEGAIRQYELIQEFKVDVVSGSVQLVDEGGRCFDIWHQPNVDDLCTAMLGPHRNCLPCAHVYLRKGLGKVRWDPETIIRQDLKWFFDLSGSLELKWKRTDEVVGVWVHHLKKRISTSMDMNTIDKYTVPMLIQAYKKIESQGRLTESRSCSAAQGLWALIHSSFHKDPLYWNKVARYTMKLNPNAKPIQPIFNFPIFKKISPLWIQWLLLTKRLIFDTHKLP